MKNFGSADVKIVAMAGHGGAGKTSIIENILYKAKVTTRIGKVDDDTSFCNYLDDEKKRKTTLNSKILSFEYNNKGIFLLDSPGYADFFGDTVGTITAADCVVLVVDAVAGIQVGTRKAWKEAERLGKGRAFFINKLDKDQADFEKTIEVIKEMYGKNCVVINVPIGEKGSLSGVVGVAHNTNIENADDAAKELADKYHTQLIDSVAETDDELLEKYLGGEELTREQVLPILERGVAKGEIYPIFCGSAEKDIGTQEFMNAIVNFFPSPHDVGAVPVAEGAPIPPEANAPFSGFIFKTVNDPFIGQLTYVRVLSGTIKENADVYNVTKGQKEKIGHMYVMNGKEQKAVPQATVGMIVAIPKMKVSTIGDSLGAIGSKTIFPAMQYPTPSISFSIHSKAKGEEEKISTGLHKLCDDDPTLHLEKNMETKEMVLSGLGDLHIEVALSRLKDKFHVEVEIGKPKIAYKETCRRSAEGHEKHKKQSGGRGQYGEVYLRIEPLARGAGFEFVDAVVGGVIPRNFLPAVEKGVVGIMTEGILAKYPVVDLKVTVHDGSYHTVDSSEMAFKIAGSKAFKDAFMKADPILLEPIMDVEVTIPDDLTGTIIGDLNSKRGRVGGMDMIGGMQIVKAQVPIAEMFSYSNELRSMTAGQGSYIMNFSHYEEVPAHLMTKVIEEAKTAELAEK
ncbi:MAG: elongation factor G [Candidatus Omnitrophica bacterium]|nr:elongation factor G [Candidatus Omnitrophota bacterium]